MSILDSMKKIDIELPNKELDSFIDFYYKEREVKNDQKFFRGKLPKRGTLVKFIGAEPVGNKSGKYVVVDTYRWKSGDNRIKPLGGVSVRVVELGHYPINEMGEHTVDISIGVWSNYCTVIKRYIKD